MNINHHLLVQTSHGNIHNASPRCRFHDPIDSRATEKVTAAEKHVFICSLVNDMCASDSVFSRLVPGPTNTQVQVGATVA